MQTTATKTATRTSPYQTRSKTAADMMDENELLHAQLARLELRVKYPVIYRKDLDDPGRHGEGAMDAAFAGDVDIDYPVIVQTYARLRLLFAVHLSHQWRTARAASRKTARCLQHACPRCA